MSRCVRTARALLLGLFVVGAVSGCSLPLLESQGEGGPTVKDITARVNCELADLVKLSKSNIERIKRMPTDTSTSYGGLVEYIRANPESFNKYQTLLNHLTDDHFVASVTMILDVLNTQGLNPSLSFISPINNSTMFNSTLGIGGSLNGSQERNISLSYSIDLDRVINQCKRPAHAATGLTGDLGLADIVVDGLLGLDLSRKVNIYGNSGPSSLPMTYQLKDWYMTLDFIKASLSGFTGLQTFDFKGSASYSPSTTNPQSPGTLSLTGVADDLDMLGNPYYSTNSYFINLNGSTFQDASGLITFLLTGTMTQTTPIGAPTGITTQSTSTDLENLQKLGFGPKLTLAGTIDNSANKKKPPESPVKITSGSIASDTTTPALFLPPLTKQSPQSGLSIPVLLCQTAVLVPGEILQCPPPERIVTIQAAASGSAPGGQSSSKVATAPTASPTQFGSAINFTISYGVNGGPNWTLATFKGPGGGGGSSSGGSGSGGGGGGGGGGQLASISRTDTDTLTITFVAACKDGDNSANPSDYWDALSRCNQNSRANAGAVGYAANQNLLLLQHFGQ